MYSFRFFVCAKQHLFIFIYLHSSIYCNVYTYYVAKKLPNGEQLFVTHVPKIVLSDGVPNED
jgi:hypothetical protein